MGDLWKSKKFRAALVGLGISVAVFVANKMGLKVSEDTLLTFLAPVLVYVGAQGVADFGKGKAEVEAKK